MSCSKDLSLPSVMKEAQTELVFKAVPMRLSESWLFLICPANHMLTEAQAT